MKFSIKDFFSKCDHIGSFLRIWSDLLKKSLMDNFILCAVVIAAFWKMIAHTLLQNNYKFIQIFALPTVFNN